MRFTSLLVLGCLVLVACGADNDEASTTGTARQSLTFDESCAKMAAWKRSPELNCQTCIAGAKQGCECAREKPWNGKCEAEAKARAAETDCSSELLNCLVLCVSDCTCKAKCVAGHDACVAKEAPLQSCLADICQSTCD
ncbi:MAG: hypothetical protein IPG50_06520 [Myxococcales bacterium]|nr:hypothetical protein [Myxococcales bacterium]